MGRDWRGVWLLDGGKGGNISPRGEDHRAAGHRRQRAADGVREHRRQFGDGRVLHARPADDGEKIFYGDYLTNAQGEDVVAGFRERLRYT